MAVGQEAGSRRHPHHGGATRSPRPRRSRVGPCWRSREEAEDRFPEAWLSSHGRQLLMLPDNQNTLLVLFFVSVIFSILVLIIICGEYFFNFETRRLRAQGEVGRSEDSLRKWGGVAKRLAQGSRQILSLICSGCYERQ